jgi:hypothetical protein
VTSGGYRRRDRTPEKIAGAETVEEYHGGAAMSVPLYVHRARPHRCSEDVSLHLYTPLLAFASQRFQRYCNHPDQE